MLTSVILLFVVFTDSREREANQRGTEKLFVLDMCIKVLFFFFK